MSAYWCVETADDRVLAEGYAGDWPVSGAALQDARERYPDEDGHDDQARTFLIAVEVYRELRQIRPDGGEIPWSEVPETVKAASCFDEAPAKVSVSF